LINNAAANRTAAFVERNRPTFRAHRHRGANDKAQERARAVPTREKSLALHKSGVFFAFDRRGVASRIMTATTKRNDSPQPPAYPGPSSRDGVGDPLLLREPLITPRPGADPSPHDPARENDEAAVPRPLRRRRPARILDRDGAFYQSRGRWRVRHVALDQARMLAVRGGDSSSSGEAEGNGGLGYRLFRCCCRCAAVRRTFVAAAKRAWSDWFHFLAYRRTVVLMAILFVAYTSIVFAYGFVYLLVSRLGMRETVNPDGTSTVTMFCDMDIHNHMEALYFSLSTMTTIGYGVSDYYFGGCWTPLLLVLAQVCSAITFDAVAIGLLFQRISRGHKRGKTVLFSDKAVVRRVRGVPYLMFRVGELRRHQLLEATVRAYCVRHERHPIEATVATGVPTGQGLDGEEDGSVVANADRERQRQIETVHYVAKPMALIHEDASSSSSQHILMSLPQVLAHRIDDKSPLAPPAPRWYDSRGDAHELPRAANKNNVGHGGGDDRLTQTTRTSHSLEEIESFLEDRDAEIVVLLEGIDELTGSASQARHSYVAGEDIGWNECFVPCVHPSPADDDESDYGDHVDDHVDDDFSMSAAGGLFRRRQTVLSSGGWGPRRCRRRGQRRPNACVVDFARFHDTAPAPPDCTSCPFIVES